MISSRLHSITFLNPIPVKNSFKRNKVVTCLLRPSSTSICMLSKENAPVSTNPKRSAKLLSRLNSLLADTDRGLEFDPDSDDLDPAEDAIETVIEDLEELNPTQVPTRSPLLSGKWKLVYTSSSITRFFGGLTGLQRLLPEGTVGPITQTISLEDATASFDEVLNFELPILGKELEHIVKAEGGLRATSEERHIWEPEKVQFFLINWWADSWKTLRAFQVADITYLDKRWRITRGQTGSVTVFEKVED